MKVGELMSDLTRYSLMLPRDLKAKLQAKADSMGLTLSAYIRLLLTAELKK